MIKQEKDNASLSSSNNSHVTVDPNKVKQGMAALFPSRDFDTDDLADALVALLEGTSWLLLLWFWCTYMLIRIPLHLYHRIYGLWGMLLTHITYTKKRPVQSHRYPFRRRPPWKRRDLKSPEIIPVDASCWIPRVLIILSTIQAPWRLIWTVSVSQAPPSS